jgi:hypothetical protein
VANKHFSFYGSLKDKDVTTLHPTQQGRSAQIFCPVRREWRMQLPEKHINASPVPIITNFKGANSKSSSCIFKICLMQIQNYKLVFSKFRTLEL